MLCDGNEIGLISKSNASPLTTHHQQDNITSREPDDISGETARRSYKETHYTNPPFFPSIFAMISVYRVRTKFTAVSIETMFDAIERYILHLLARDYRSNEFIVTIIRYNRKTKENES